MSAKIEQQYYTPQEYLELERKAQDKSEFYFGEIFLMSGGNPEHSLISLNICSELRARLKGKNCRTFESNMKIGVPNSKLFSYPDGSVVCGEPRFRDNQGDVLMNPNLIIEVVSPSTEAFDRGKKFFQYQQIPTFTDYILVSQDEPRLEHYAKQKNGTWVLTMVEGLKGNLTIPALGCKVRLSEVYYQLTFPKNKRRQSAQLKTKIKTTQKVK
ncbi:MAG: Uma2 family endonuclease [Acidobacteriota bacterium]